MTPTNSQKLASPEVRRTRVRKPPKEVWPKDIPLHYCKHSSCRFRTPFQDEITSHLKNVHNHEDPPRDMTRHNLAGDVTPLRKPREPIKSSPYAHSSRIDRSRQSRSQPYPAGNIAPLGSVSASSSSACESPLPPFTLPATPPRGRQPPLTPKMLLSPEKDALQVRQFLRPTARPSIIAPGPSVKMTDPLPPRPYP